MVRFGDVGGPLLMFYVVCQEPGTEVSYVLAGRGEVAVRQVDVMTPFP